MILLLLALQAMPAAPPGDPPVGDDIVVVAARRNCRVRFANRDMSESEFRRRASEWAAGKPVRVIARQSTDINCLAKIAFKLADRGVRLIQFVEPADLAAPVVPIAGHQP